MCKEDAVEKNEWRERSQKVDKEWNKTSMSREKAQVKRRRKVHRECSLRYSYAVCDRHPKFVS